MKLSTKSLVLLGLVNIIGMVACTSWWSNLTASKQRFFKHMGKQLPWMPFRYFA